MQHGACRGTLQLPLLLSTLILIPSKLGRRREGLDAVHKSQLEDQCIIHNSTPRFEGGPSQICGTRMLTHVHSYVPVIHGYV